MKGAILALALAACHSSAQNTVKADVAVETVLDATETADGQDYEHTSRAERRQARSDFHEVDAPLAQDTVATLDVDPVPATATSPAKPGKHYRVERKTSGGGKTIDAGTTSHELENDKSAKTTQDKVVKAVHEGAKLGEHIEADEKKSIGVDWKLYLYLGLGGFAALVAGWLYLKFMRKVAWL